MAVSKTELQWREWLLGEGRYKRKGQKSEPRPEIFPLPIPVAWWQRLEAFLAKRSDYSEPGRKTDQPAGDSKPADPAKLSAHFNVREFDCHDGRRVPAIAVPALKRLCKKILEPMRAEFGPGHVLSGYRPKDYNARIGGATFSQHIYELTPDSVAADTMWATGTPKEWAAYADELAAGGVGRYDSSGFVHTDNRPGRARWTG